MGRSKQPPQQVSIDKSTNRAYVWWDNAKIYFGKAGSLEASKKFAQWYSSQTCGEPFPLPDPQSITIAGCAVAYQRHARAYYSEDGKTTIEFNNLRVSLQILVEYAGSCLAVDFGPKKLMTIQSSLSAEQTSDEDETPRYARSTINAHIRRIRRCLRWCAAQEMIPASVVTGLDMVNGIPAGRGLARETSPVEPVPISVVIATLPFVSPTVATMIRVQTLCGMRPQDVCRMTPDAIDRTGDVWLYRPAKHKNARRGKTLTKAIPAEAQNLLISLLNREPGEPVFSTSDSLEYWRQTERKQSTKWLPIKPRRAYSTGSYGKSIVYGIARAAKLSPPIKIPHWQPNQLRHLIATQLRESVGIEASQLFLGHAKPDITLLYAQASDAKLASIARTLVSPFQTVKSATE